MLNAGGKCHVERDESFEIWARSKGYSVAYVEKDGQKIYHCKATRHAFNGWRATTEQQGAGGIAVAQQGTAPGMIKSAYIRKFGSDEGWVSSHGSFFIEGYNAALAARQPVGEPVAWQWKLRVEGERGWETSLRPISADILNDPECEHRALYTAPPAAVDLAQLRQLEAKFRKYGDGEVGMAFSGPYYSCADELRALIDSKAVRNG